MPTKYIYVVRPDAHACVFTDRYAGFNASIDESRSKMRKAGNKNHSADYVHHFRADARTNSRTFVRMLGLYGCATILTANEYTYDTENV